MGLFSSSKTTVVNQSRVDVGVDVNPDIVVVNEIDNGPIQDLVNTLSESEVVEANAFAKGLQALATAQEESSRMITMVGAGVALVVFLFGGKRA